MGGMFLKELASEVVERSRMELSSLRTVPKGFRTVFDADTHYDCICPLPSSKGQASEPNISFSKVLAKCFGDIPVKHLILRSAPMKVKSTRLSASVRRSPDATRQIHYDTLDINPELRNWIQGKSILMYDDVCTWGNTSEAVRNLLLIMGAEQVDLITAFSTGPIMYASEYAFKAPTDSKMDLKDYLTGSGRLKAPTKELFEMVSRQAVEKHILTWDSQPNEKSWHDTFGKWISQRYPDMVLNDGVDVD
jgi:hypothetical protein